MIRKQVKVISAKYVKDTKSILILGECEEGRLTHQMHRSLFSFGKRSETEIVAELNKTAEMMKGKTIWMEFEGTAKEVKESTEVTNYEI